MRKLLLVDDDARVRELLRACLESPEYEIVEARSAEEALASVGRGEPDLILLDADARGMDGFEVARRLKSAVGEEGIVPLLMVTPADDREGRRRALKNGADDLVTLPFDREELVLRVANLLRTRDREALLRQRARKALEAANFRDEMSALLVHDLKGPTSVVQLSLEYMESSASRVASDFRDVLRDARAATDRIERIVHNMLDIAQLEAGRLVLRTGPTRPAELLNLVAHCREPVARRHGVHLELAANPDVQMEADVDLIIRVIENVVDNALEHVPCGGRILMSVDSHAGSTTILIGNDGPPVPTDMRQRIFEKFGREGIGKPHNLGLGLYFCRLAVEAHGGKISVSDQPLPAVFCMRFPRAMTASSREDSRAQA
jgi:two-component system, sensor histidine kinase and response regulator